MRVKLLGMDDALLPTEFEAPAGVDQPVYSAFHIHPHPNSAVVAIPLFGRNGTTAVWDSSTGKLLWQPARAGDIGWSPDGRTVYVVSSRFGPGPHGGIGHRFLRFSWPDRKLQEELVFGVPSGGVDRLVVSEAGGLAAVVSIQGPEWYYTLIRLRPALAQEWPGHRINDYLVDGPVFSPDERYIVTAGCYRVVWWADTEDDEEEWQLPSQGGNHELGCLHVHDLANGRKTRHTLVTDLPAGWQPVPRVGEEDGWGWMVFWGPQFTGDRSFLIWLPGGSAVELQLPLPEVVEVPAPHTTWQRRSG